MDRVPLSQETQLSNHPSPQMTGPELMQFVGSVFPHAMTLGFDVCEVGPGVVAIDLNAGEEELRPGGTVSGPTMMTMADTAMWLLTLSIVGPVELTVTTGLSIQFLNRPQPGRLVATANLLKNGSRLVVGDVRITSGPEELLVAQATVTYSVPPAHRR